jgi:hypothetical protein
MIICDVTTGVLLDSQGLAFDHVFEANLTGTSERIGIEWGSHWTRPALLDLVIVP